MAIVVLPAWSEWPTLKRIRVRNPIVISAKDTVQIREAQANVGDSFGTGMSMDGGNTFSCGNKLNIVIRTIMEAKRITPAGKDIIVYITDELLNIINIEELHNILLKLQNDKRILTLKYFPDYLLPYAAVTKKAFNEGIMDVLEPSRKQFRVETNKKFIRLAKRLEVL
jgi:hypothetical protein